MFVQGVKRTGHSPFFPGLVVPSTGFLRSRPNLPFLTAIVAARGKSPAGPRRRNPKGDRGLRPLDGVTRHRRCPGIDSSSCLASDRRSLARDPTRLLPRAGRGRPACLPQSDRVGCPFRQGRTRGCAPTFSFPIFPHLDRFQLQICLAHLFMQSYSDRLLG